jgi:uncharacterized OsmC-like protein
MTAQTGAEGTEEHDARTYRSVSLTRTAAGRYEATNARGGSIAVGSGEDDDFTPVELLLAALAGCSAIDVDGITGKRAEPEVFDVLASGDKVRDDDASHMVNLRISFDVRFPEGRVGMRHVASSTMPSSCPTTVSAR